MPSMTISLKDCGLWMCTGLLTLSLGACIAQEPSEDDDSSSSKKKKNNKKDGEEDNEDSDGKSSETDGETEGDSDGKKDSETGDSGGDKPAGLDGVVTGTVVDESGDAIEGVAVGVCADDPKVGGCLPPIPTDKKGAFEFKGIPNHWTDFHATVSPGPETKYELFVASMAGIHVKKGGVEVDVGQLTFIKIDSDEKGDTFKDAKGETTFKAGKFSFTMDATQLEPGNWAEGFDPDIDNQYFASIELPSKLLRDEEKEIDGKEVVSAWGLFPYGGYLKTPKPEDKEEQEDGQREEVVSASFKLSDDLGQDDGQELIVYQQHHVSGKMEKIATTEVKKGAIEIKSGLTSFTRLYFVKK